MYSSDVFRYVNAFDEEVQVAAVTGSGDCVVFNDEYEGYYDMYACEKIQIDKFLSRDEVIALMLRAHVFDVTKFIKTYKMTSNEIAIFFKKFTGQMDIERLLLYYQCGQKQVYENGYCMKKVLEYGQNSN